MKSLSPLDADSMMQNTPNKGKMCFTTVESTMRLSGGSYPKPPSSHSKLPCNAIPIPPEAPTTYLPDVLALTFPYILLYV